MTRDIIVGAVSLVINYPSELMEVIDVKLQSGNSEKDLYYTTSSKELRIGWFASEEAISLIKDETLLVIKVKTKSNFKAGDVINLGINNSALCELADATGSPVENVYLSAQRI